MGPYRSIQFRDILIDIFGVFLVFFVIQGLIWIKGKFSKAQ